MKKKFLLLIYSILIIIFLFLCFIQINKPLHHEESFLAYGANKLANSEKPEFSFEGYGLGKMSILVHPPLYIYTVTFFVKLFGYNLFGLKFSGIFFAVLTSLIVLFMGFHLFPDDKKLSILAVFIFLIHPIVIQNSLLMDIDGGILAFLTVLTIFIFMKYRLDKPLLLSGVLFLGLWTKMTSFVILSVSFFVFLLFFEKYNRKNFFSKEKAKKIIKLIMILIVSLTVFLITYYIYTSSTGLDFSQTFKHNSIGKFGERFNDGIILNFLKLAGSFKTFVIWVNPLIGLFFAFIFIRDFKKIINRKIDKNIILMYIIIIFSICFFVFSGVIIGLPGKYFVFLMPLFSLLITKELSIQAKEYKKNKLILILFIVGIIIIEYYLLFLGDPIFTEDIWMTFSQFNFSLVLSILLKITIIIFPVFILFVIFRKNFILAIILLIFLFGTYSAIYTSFAPYSTNNNYGDYGVEESINYLKNSTGGEKATIIAERSVCFFWNNGDYLDNIQNNAYLYVVSQYYLFADDFYDSAVITKDNTYVVIYEHNIYRTQGFKEHLESHFDYIKTIGTYDIYKIKRENI